ncbi:bacteriocin-type signal sequence-containing protein [Nannocystis exedens]|uniref:Bacteriocin-type signal sequence-containing protein n=1 Tax=Nannocystis exedens TaxID=54 RepID=A0A1I2GR87_9BACT|nr:hypothetical protein [Nannocystis exedens]PCC68744.1 hypothetical protein NAEX_01761 [Nannocystis exedens]SFF19570.1 bacteriocin-type signal sequence-containing protein [Nannocystis exedens]
MNKKKDMAAHQNTETTAPKKLKKLKVEVDVARELSDEDLQHVMGGSATETCTLSCYTVCYPIYCNHNQAPLRRPIGAGRR